MLLEKLENFRKRGMLRKAEGDAHWVFRFFLVPKPGTNKWRLVIDYRFFNSFLEGKNSPLPIVRDQPANQQGNFIFSLIDLEDGFRQMHLEEDSKHLMAFCTPFGVFEWNVLRMGVKVGPATFQEMVQHVTRKYPASTPYIDDILSLSGKGQLPTQQRDIPLHVTMEDPVIRGGYIKQHYQDLVALFQALEEAKLTVKPTKCHF